MRRPYLVQSCVNTPRSYIIALCICIAQAFVLLGLGQSFLSESGVVEVWHGTVLSPENSQQFSDWYTFSHIIHGVLFFALLSVILPRASIGVRFALAIGLEAGWEFVENTPLVIEHYRTQALAQGYSGDSVVNSLSDTFAAAAGFFFASRAPAWASVALVVCIELVMLYAIRDSLTLNVLGFISPLEWVRVWQAGSF